MNKPVVATSECNFQSGIFRYFFCFPRKTNMFALLFQFWSHAYTMDGRVLCCWNAFASSWKCFYALSDFLPFQMHDVYKCVQTVIFLPIQPSLTVLLSPATCIHAVLRCGFTSICIRSDLNTRTCISETPKFALFTESFWISPVHSNGTQSEPGRMFQLTEFSELSVREISSSLDNEELIWCDDFFLLAAI